MRYIGTIRGSYGFCKDISVLFLYIYMHIYIVNVYIYIYTCIYVHGLPP